MKLNLLFIAFFLLATMPVGGQNLRNAYQKYKAVTERCNRCLDDRNEQELISLKEGLGQVETYIAEIDPTDIERNILLMFVYEKCLRANTLLYNEGLVSLPEMTRNIEKIKWLQRYFSLKSSVLAKFKNNRWPSQYLEILGLKNNTEQQFSDVLWPALTTAVQNAIVRAENMAFEKLTPGKTLRELEFFLGRSHYADNSYNHRAPEAFMVFYRGITSSGDPLDLAEFQVFVTEKKRGLEPWQTIFKDSALFSKQYRADSKLLNWANQKLQNARVQTTTLVDVIQKTAPREVALVALQRLVKALLDRGEYDEAIGNWEEYDALFKTQGAMPYIREKYQAIKELLYDLRDGRASTTGGSISPVEGLSSPDRNEIRIFMNKSENLLVTEPPATGQVVVHQRLEVDRFEPVKSIDVAIPGANIYLFEPKKNSQPDNVISIAENSLPVTRIPQGADSYDYFMGATVIFFVSYSSYERMKQRRDEELMGEYASPGFVHTNVRFQELRGPIGYHGRSSGNPNTDIYYMVLGQDQTWSEPRLLPLVNTPYCERSPVLSADGGKLFFASEGVAGLGGLDIYTVPVSVNRNNKTVQITGAVQNVTAVNSTGDDLYYLPLRNGTDAYFSSNRQNPGDFDIFLYREENEDNGFEYNHNKIEKQEDIPVNPEPIRIEQSLRSSLSDGSLSATTPSARFLPPSAPVDFSVRCDWDVQTAERLSQGPTYNMIRVTGQIFNKQRKLYKSAKIIFEDHDTGKVISDSIQLETSQFYKVNLQEDSKYHVRVYGYDEEGGLFSGFTDEFVYICKKEKGESNIAKRDFQLSEVEDILRSGHRLMLPFFFDFNKSQYTVSNSRMIETSLGDLLRRWQSIPTAQIRLVGFADTIGDPQYNLALALERAGYAGKFLEKRQMNTMPIQTLSKGETEHFNIDADKDEYVGRVLSYELWNKLNSSDEKRRQMNRRVEIMIIGTPN